MMKKPGHAVSRSQHLLITLLGDYWKGRSEHIPSAALVRILGEFQIGPLAARPALSRLAARGLLARSQRGRRTSYGLTKRALQLLDEGAARIFSFGAEERHWDGKWSIVAFSVSETDRDRRHALRTRLRWLGFAPLYPGLWISPGGGLEVVRHELLELRVSNATLFRAESLSRGAATEGPLAAWDLADLRRRYMRFIRHFAPYRDRLRRDAMTPRKALVERTRLMDAWREFPRIDPDLPAEFLPRDWPRREARTLFLELYDALGTMAERRVRDIVREEERRARATPRAPAASRDRKRAGATRQTRVRGARISGSTGR